jgi:hypothetical protein
MLPTRSRSAASTKKQSARLPLKLKNLVSLTPTRARVSDMPVKRYASNPVKPARQ